MRHNKRTEDSLPQDESLPSMAVGPPLTAKTGSHARRTEIDNPLLGHPGVPTLIVDDQHRIRAFNPECAQIFAGERLLRRRCYQVFHHRDTACEGGGRHCPLRHYRESGEPCRVVHVHHTPRGEEHHEISIHPTGRPDLGTRLELRPIEVAAVEPCPCRMVGRSPAFNHMLELLLRAASRETPVIILGEPGTCRETVARALHRLGGKTDSTFAAIYCTGLRGQRFTSELSRLMRDEPDGHPATPIGTLYLEDIDTLGLAEQGELLRLTKDTGCLRRGGGTRGGASRLVCAARPDLAAKVEQGTFLSDLYYRVCVFPIPLPALRESREEDLPLLCEYLLRQIGGDPPAELHPRTLAILNRYPFPGNLRELRRILERAHLQAAGRQILPGDLPRECLTGLAESARV